MADAPALGAGAAKAAWRFDPSLAYQVRGQAFEPASAARAGTTVPARVRSPGLGTNAVRATARP